MHRYLNYLANLNFEERSAVQKPYLQNMLNQFLCLALLFPSLWRAMQIEFSK